MEAKYMKTSGLITWKCNLFTYGLLKFRFIEYMNMRVYIHTSYTQAWASNILSKVQAPLQQLRHQHESVGEWRRRKENSKCMELQPENKMNSFRSIDMYEFPLHQPTWKGIEIPRNWFNQGE